MSDLSPPPPAPPAVDVLAAVRTANEELDSLAGLARLLVEVTCDGASANVMGGWYVFESSLERLQQRYAALEGAMKAAQHT